MDPSTTLVKQKYVHIQGNNYGQIAVGNVVYQIGYIEEGGVVNFIVPEEKPVIEVRPAPIQILPRRARGMLDRKDEIESALEELAAGVPVEFFGESGIGKTVMLRLLAHHPDIHGFPDGIIYMLGQEQPVEDLLQCFFDAFYKASHPYKPNEAQIRIALSGKRALILLDDLALDSSRVQVLMDAAPDCTFVLASQQRRLWGEVSAIALQGLPEEEAQQLFQRELGRQIAQEEIPFAQQISTALQGQPLRLLQAASLARENKLTVIGLANYLLNGDPNQQLNKALLKGTKEDDKRLLAAMAVIGVPMPAGVLGDWLKLADPVADLIALSQRGLVQTSENSFRLVDGLRNVLQETWDLAPWREWLLDALTRSLEPLPNATGDTKPMIDVGLKLIEWLSGSARWDAAIRLARLLDPHLVMSRRWGTWEQVLHTALEAATTLGDLPGRAWAMHQLGTRALCLGDKTMARDLLIKALRMRHMLGDSSGAKVTNHNLSLLLGPPTGGSNGGTKPPRLPSLKPVGFMLPIITVLMTAAVILAVWSPEILPTEVATPTFILVPTLTEPADGILLETRATMIPSLTPGLFITQTPTHTATQTPTNTVTQTPTHTATATFTDTSTSTSTPCGPFPGWVRYTIRRGDTLNRLANATSTTVSQIMLANCLNGTTIIDGNQLWLPYLPVDPTTAVPDAQFQGQSPDLVVVLTNEGIDLSGGEPLISLTITINNVGQALADWKIVGWIEYSYDGSPFDLKELPNPSFGYLRYSFGEILLPGESVTDNLKLPLDRTWLNTIVLIQAHVNTCSEGSGMCTYPEINVRNNVSDQVKVHLWADLR
jgi:LysM repeat protein